MIQPQVPLRLPCYDFIPITSPTLGHCLLAVNTCTSGRTGFHDVTGGVYKARERIHGVVADTPLLAIPTSWSRVADSNPNWARLCGFAQSRDIASHCTGHCSTRCSPGRKGHTDLTPSPPSHLNKRFVFPESPALPAGNWKRGLRSLPDLTEHLTTRADDSHAAPVHRPAELTNSFRKTMTGMSRPGKVLRVASN